MSLKIIVSPISGANVLLEIAADTPIAVLRHELSEKFAVPLSSLKVRLSTCRGYRHNTRWSIQVHQSH